MAASAEPQDTVLVTGGASGIGFALAERFLRDGHRVIVCGRREDKLREAAAKHPALATRVCDVADADQRRALVQWATREHPRLNVLVNNAGIQQRFDLRQPIPWTALHQEIVINLESAIDLALLFVPHLSALARATIANVTSGLSFTPIAAVPIYCATKAALHSFTLSLRHQLAATSIRVVEILPPAVNTDLGGPGLHTFGVALDEFADAAMAGWKAGQLEIAYGFAAQASRASRDDLDAMFARMNAPR